VSTTDDTTLRQLAYVSQCITPVIEGLLSEKDEKDILDLIFILATWHAYAKLRLHTDHTLASFDALAKPLGATLRHFAGKFSDHFDTNTGDKGPNTHWAHCEHIESIGNM